MILVTTTGKVGSEASRLLAKRGVPVRVLAHHPSKVAALAEAGVDVVEGDLDVPESIDVAMQGVSSVVLVSPAIPVQEFNVIESAMQAGGAGVGMQNFLMLARAVASSGSFASCTETTYWPTGPERLSYADAARVLSNVLGREISFRPITCEEQKQAMIDAGLPEVVADDNAKALTLFADGDADYVTDDVPGLLGRPARSFEQFVTDFAVTFS